jgi:hypothetical protein
MSEPWTPETYPAVAPDAKFRQDLQRALEQTHRQQSAQRKLGTHGRGGPLLSPRRLAGFALLLFALLLLARWLRGVGGESSDPAA